MIFLAVVAALSTLFLIWKWKTSYWQIRGVRCLDANFPFGSIADIVLMRKTIGEVYDEIYYKLEGSPFGGIYRFWWPALFVRDPDLIQDVFIKEFSSFHDNDYFVNPDIDPMLGLNPFNSKGERWKHVRGIVTPSLTLAKVREMTPQIKLICSQMTEYLKTREDEYLEGYDLMGKFTTDVVGCCAYGLDGNSFNDPNSVLRQMSSKMFDGSLKGNIALLCALYAPSLGRILKFKILSEEVNEYFIGIVKEAVSQRKKLNITRKDFLQTLINTNDEAAAKGQPKIYSEEEMAGHAMTFFLDGYETVAILLGFIMYELSLNPAVQEKLRQEILKVGSKLSDFEFDSVHVHDLGYLDMVVMETLRKHPSGTSFARTCTKDVVLKAPDGSEVRVEKGAAVILPMYSLHNDPKYFPEPDRFDPTRFTEENKQGRPRFCFFPFSGGPRMCPGNLFAMTMVKLAVITILFEFSLEPKETPTGKLELDPKNQFFHTAKHGLWVKYSSLSK